MLYLNPLYDGAFKYLLEEAPIARIFLSGLIGLELESVDIQPQELTLFQDVSKANQARAFSTYRLDFAAKTYQRDGKQQLILIEMQKKRHLYQTMRFRKYIGKQYLNSSYFQTETNLRGHSFKKGIPLFPIYFLGEQVPEWRHIPVIEIDINLIDRRAITLPLEPNAFIEALYHKGLIVHIPAIPTNPRDEKEALLQIFNQRNSIQFKPPMEKKIPKQRYPHTLEIDPADFPEKFLPILQRLHEAAMDPAVRAAMVAEDEYYAEIEEYEQSIAEARQEAEQAQQQKEQARQEAEQAQQKAEQAQQKAEQAQQKAEQAQQQKENAVRWLLQLGVSTDDITKKFGLSTAEIEQLQSS